MDKIARLASRDRQELFGETAARKQMTPAIAEKDFWVTWTLYKLFSHPALSKLLIFKGGTSLSKAFGLIERFSEDIDLILDWRVLTGEDPQKDRSKSKQETLNKKINAEAKEYIAGTLYQMVRESIGPICTCSVDPDDPFVLNVRYPAAFSDQYLRPEVRLEIGPLASWLPYDSYPIQSYAAEEFPDLFDITTCDVPTIVAERTFWEKATILHHEANRPEGNPQPPRYSRHYYDLAMMAKSSAKEQALADMELLENVVTFKKRFYPRGWADYEAAKPGTFKLVPEGHVYQAVKEDYKAMRSMIFGHYPEFDEIVHFLQELEDEINSIGVL